MGVEVVHHQRDALGRWVFLGNVPDEVRPINLGLALGHFGHALPGQWLICHEDVASAQALIFVVFSFGLARLGRYGLAYLSDQLSGCLIHAHNRSSRVVGTPVNVQHVLHRCHELGI